MFWGCLNEEGGLSRALVLGFFFVLSMLEFNITVLWPTFVGEAGWGF